MAAGYDERSTPCSDARRWSVALSADAKVDDHQRVAASGSERREARPGEAATFPATVTDAYPDQPPYDPRREREPDEDRGQP